MTTNITVGLAIAFTLLGRPWHSPRSHHFAGFFLRLAAYMVVSAGLAGLFGVNPAASIALTFLAVVLVASSPESIHTMVLRWLKPFSIYARFARGRRLLLRNVLCFSIEQMLDSSLRDLLVDSPVTRFQDMSAGDWQGAVEHAYSEIAMAYLLNKPMLPDQGMAIVQSEIVGNVAGIQTPYGTHLFSHDCPFLELAMGTIFNKISQNAEIVTAYLLENQHEVSVQLDAILSRPANENAATGNVILQGIPA